MPKESLDQPIEVKNSPPGIIWPTRRQLQENIQQVEQEYQLKARSLTLKINRELADLYRDKGNISVRATKTESPQTAT